MSVPLDMRQIFQPTPTEYPERPTASPSTPPSAADPTSISPPSPDSPTIPPPEPSSANLTQLTDSANACIAEVRKKVSLWNAEWGPIRHWPRLFENEFGDAKEKQCSGEWVDGVQLVVDEGRKIVNQLQQAVEANLPSDDWMVRDLWRSSLLLMAHLLEGITVLETRLEIVAPYPYESIGQYSHGK